METRVRTPHDVFTLSQHLNVPLYQRRYVWDESEQWEPLWADVRRTAELHLSGTPTATHFLGAMVLQSLDQQVGEVQQWSVVDGQQRLTTLQLLMDAAAAELEDKGEQRQAGRLRKLTHNDEDEVNHPDDVLKLRHSNADHGAYVEVMDAPAPVDYETLSDPQSKLVRAHRYFSAQVRDWLIDSASLADRADALVSALRMGLQVVAITLRPDENSQEIFETLNARGTPLTSADLIRNLLFQRLAGEGEDSAAAYRDYWKLFESAFWDKQVSVGRFLQPRTSVFLGQWLTSRTGDEIGSRAFFSRFKYFVEHEFGGSTLNLLKLLRTQALTYEHWTREAHSRNTEIDQVPLAVYRMDAANLEVAKPLLIWLHEPDHPKPADVVSVAVSAIESWLMRRMLMRLPTSDLSRVVANLIAANRAAPVDELAVRLQDQLARERTASAYWPGDDDVRTALAGLPAYTGYPRTRLRMVLETIEDARRGYLGSRQSRTGSRIARNQMHIEHLLPRSWQRHWPVADLAGQITRDQHVHRLGNLTLLTQTLNSEVSNGPWLGPNGKHSALEQHDVCLMTRDVWRRHADSWTEDAIDARGEEMLTAFLATWPVPEGHQGHVDEPVTVDVQVSLSQIVAAGLLVPGTTLVPRGAGLPSALVTDQGSLDVGGTVFDSPSGAGRASAGHGVNGWYYWRLPDGRRLRDLRDVYLRGTRCPEESGTELGRTMHSSEAS